MSLNRDSERLLVLTLGLEAAIADGDWLQVTELFRARKVFIEETTQVAVEHLKGIAASEERMLTLLKSRLTSVRADMRNLSAVLKIAGPYAKVHRASSLSLAS